MKKSLFFAALFCAVTLSAETYLSDGALIQVGDSYMSENIVRPGDIDELKQGTLSYDPVNHVLTMTDTYILTPSDATAVIGMALGCTNMPKENQQIEIRLVGQNIIEAQKTGIWGALMLGEGNYIITGMNGSLKIGSDDGVALWLMCESLTIKDGAFVYAGYPIDYKETSVGTITLSDPTPVVTINCATFYSFGTTSSMAGINPGLINAEETNGYVYNSSDETWKESDGKTTLKNKILEFAPTKHVFQWVNANPEGGTITVTKDGNPLPNPYYYGKDEENTWVDILATPNEGWEFAGWRTSNLGAVWSGTAEDKYGLPELSQTGMLIGYFRHKQHPAPSKTWYALSEFYEKIYSFDDWVTSPTVVTESFLSDMSATKLKFATFAEGRLFYIDQETTNKSGLYSVDFDPSTGQMSDVQMHINAQDVYQKFYCLTYDFTDGFLYGIATKSDDEQYLVRVNLKTNVISAIGKIENTDINNSIGVYLLAANNEGELYGIFKCGEQFSQEKTPYIHGSMLCKINKTTAAVTPIGWTGQYFEQPHLSMAFDYKTDELIATSYSSGLSCIFSIDVKTGHTTPLQEYTSYSNGLFQIAPKQVTVSVGVKSGDEDKGSAVILETGKSEGKYFVGDEVDIEAFKKTNEYRFVKWSDGNTDNPRTITVTDAANTYMAEFDFADDIVAYPIWINDKKRQLTSLSGELNNGNCDYISAGSITFDPETNTLTLDGLEISSDGDALTIGSTETDSLDLTVQLLNTSTLTSYGTAIVSIANASVTFVGEGDIQTQSYYYSSAYILDKATVTFDGVNMTIEGNEYGIYGVNKAHVVFHGAAMDIRGIGSGAIAQLDKLELIYCSITAPTDAAFNPQTHQVEVGGSIVDGMTSVVITPFPKISCKPIEEGTATFVLKSENEEFNDVGWFESGTKITITAKPASGFAFGHWTDDPDWKDKSNKIGSKRELDVPAVNTDLEAVFYFNPESDADWFGINGDAFVKFGFSDHAEKAARATNAISDIKGGDWFDGTWVFVSDDDVKKISFSGTLKDGEDIKGDIKDYNDQTISGVTDMAYDLSGDALYAVAGSKLYKITSKENKEIATFKLDDVETAVVAIAFDADGKMYALGVGDGTEGVLYTVSLSKDVATLKIVGKKENGGKIGIKVNNAPQSLVFDAQTGELFWGAPDYIRLINIEKMKTFIVGDLGQKAGMQGYIQSMHRMVELVEVTVQVAEDQESWGVVYLNEDKSTTKNPEVIASFVEGTPVTIKAEANDGYHFVEWVYLDGNKEKSFKGNDAETYEFAAEDITYIAYFEEDEEGIESIQISEVRCQKILLDGTLYIIMNGKIYNALGELVK